MDRRDGLTPGQEVYVIQLFDKDGYYTSCKGNTEADRGQKAAKRSTPKGFVATTIPFLGKWNGITLDVSVPPDFKEASDRDRPPTRGGLA